MKKPTAALAVLLLAVSTRAQNQPDKVQELERKLDALSQEVEQLKLGGAATAPGYAEKGSTILKRLSLGGYADFQGQFPSRRDQKGDNSGLRKTFDLRQAVLEGEYRFTDWILFRFEMEFEHAGSGAGSEQRGEVDMEQAYVDFRYDDALNARVGHLLVPMGMVNLWHEPPFFHGVRRPSVETAIIPSTWHENGAGVFGKWSVLEYQTYVVAGLDAFPQTGAPTVGGFQGSSGVREGRSEGSQSPFEEPAWVARLDARPIAGTLVGGSLYVGRADQTVGGSQVPVSLWETHLSADWHGAELRALYTEGTIGNAGGVNVGQLAANPAFTDTVGRRLFGGHVTTAFNVLSLAKTTRYLAPFFRYERYDTAARTPRGFTGNPATSRVEYTTGLTYKPIPQLALKADMQWLRNEARTGVNQWDLGCGFVF